MRDCDTRIEISVSFRHTSNDVVDASCWEEQSLYCGYRPERKPRGPRYEKRLGLGYLPMVKDTILDARNWKRWGLLGGLTHF